MMHTEHDAYVFAYELLLVLGTVVVGGYAVAILIALLLKAFRSRAAMYTWLVLSVSASIPFVLLCALIIQSGEWGGSEVGLLPDPLDDWPLLQWVRADFVMLLPEAALLCFVWGAPPVQYRSLPHKTAGSAGADVFG